MSSLHKTFDEGAEMNIVGRVLLTVGVILLSVSVAIGAVLWEDVGATLRTFGGIGVAGFMVVLGELLSRRSVKSWWNNDWITRTLMSCGYSLAYFFVYASYYVPGLHVMETPYLCWIFGPALGAIGTIHGRYNSNMRWFATVFTMVVTGHALFHALSSTVVVTVPYIGLSIKVAALGCFFGALWGAVLSWLYGRLQVSYEWKDADTFEKQVDWLLYKIGHEFYFVVAAANAMALPLFLASGIVDAPIWWAIQAPVLLAISWRNGNLFKHGVVGVMWAAAALVLLGTVKTHPVGLLTILSVIASGAGMGLVYRRLKGDKIEKNVRVWAYVGYLYGAVLVSLAVPVLMHGFWDAMPYWMISSLVVAGLSLKLRDGYLHDAGWLTGLASLVIFFLHYATWSWALVGPVVAMAYALSIAYAYVVSLKGWEEDDFLPWGRKQTVSVAMAQNLELLWSWVGCATLVAASYLLVEHQMSVIWWAIEGLVLVASGFVALGFFSRNQAFRLQGLLAFALAAGKLVFWDISGGFLGYSPEAALTMFRALQFAVVGGAMVAASLLYFRREEQVKLEAAAKNASGGSGNGDVGNGSADADSADKDSTSGGDESGNA